MLKVGVTGGLCTGKGLVTSFFSDRGAPVLDADSIAHKFLDDDEEARHSIVEEFGSDVLDRDGRIIRRKLAVRAFSDTGKLKKLNAIIHPKVKTVIREWLKERENEGEKNVAVVNVPLLIEADMLDDFDVVIVVTASKENQIRRSMDRDGVSRSEALARIGAQLPLSEKEAYADYVLRNDSNREAVKTKVEEIWKELMNKSWKKRISS